MREITKKTILNKLKTLWSLYVRTRAKFKCEWCGKQKNQKSTDAHHIIPKSRCGMSGRFDVDNGICLCDYCHRFRKNAESVEYSRWLEKHLAKKELTYDLLNETYVGISKQTIEDLKVKLFVLETMYNTLL